MFFFHIFLRTRRGEGGRGAEVGGRKEGGGRGRCQINIIRRLRIEILWLI